MIPVYDRENNNVILIDSSEIVSMSTEGRRAEPYFLTKSGKKYFVLTSYDQWRGFVEKDESFCQIDRTMMVNKNAIVQTDEEKSQIKLSNGDVLTVMGKYSKNFFNN